ncbi:MAG: 4Fe-4S dicluster domain-containing protein [Rhodothermaceae bacterium]
MAEARLQRVFVFDSDLCIGCNGCSAACQNINNTTSDLPWRKVHKLPPCDGDNKTFYISMSCNHCENPPCMNACPTNSYTKRESDGVVIHNSETCMGCKYCQMACPYGAIKWNNNQGIVNKCHFCFERLDKDEQPACVQTCFAGALTQQIINIEEMDETHSKEIPGIKYMPDVNYSIRFILKGEKFKPERDEIFPPVVNRKEEPNG